jgi:hypothetical protein
VATRTRALGRRNPPQFSLERGEEGQIKQSEFERLTDGVNEISSVLHSGITLGTGEASSPTGNLNGQWVIHTFSSAANTLEAIPHGLGRTPVFAKAMIADRACHLYDPDFKAGWGKGNIQLACDTASAKVLIWIQA